MQRSCRRGVGSARTVVDAGEQREFVRPCAYQSIAGDGDPLTTTRQFTDRSGVRWRVYEVAGASASPESSAPRERRTEVRSANRTAPKTKRLTTRPLELSWLCFESRAERRRVSPVPSAWEGMAEDELEDLMGQSEVL